MTSILPSLLRSEPHSNLTHIPDWVIAPADLLIAGSFHPSLLLLPSPLSHLQPPSPDSTSTPPGGRTILLPAKPLALTSTADRLVVAMAERLVYVFDLGRLAAGKGEGWAEPEQKRESALKGVTRDVEGMSDGLGARAWPSLATSMFRLTRPPARPGWTACSVDGRIAVEYFSPTDQAKKYAFKAHRLAAKPDAAEGDSLFAINALAGHPSRELFASAGSDGAVCLWDSVARKRAKSWRFKGPVGVCAWAGKGGEWIGVGFGALEQEGPAGDGRDVGCVVKWVG
jgi:cell cycle arrest protein BUB3